MAKDLLCSVLVNSCDSYEEAWEPFFKLFFKFWPNCPYNIYLATQTKHYNHPNVTTINTIDGTWSERINRALHAIDTPYVLLFLEDYFLQAPVKYLEFKKYLDYIQKDQSVGAFYFNKIGGFRVPSEKYPDMYDMNKTILTKYHLNCQVALWNKQIFEEATSVPMSPWEFECNGFEMVPNTVKEKEFYCSQTTVHSKVQNDDIFTYLIHPKTGYGISKQKWLWNNRKLFKKYGIDCECNTLPTLTWFDYNWPLIKIKVLKPFVKIYSMIRR